MSELQPDILHCIGNTSLLALRNVAPATSALQQLASEMLYPPLLDRALGLKYPNCLALHEVGRGIVPASLSEAQNCRRKTAC